MSDSEISEEEVPMEPPFIINDLAIARPPRRVLRYRIHFERPPDDGIRSVLRNPNQSIAYDGIRSVLRDPNQSVAPPLIGLPEEYDRNLTPAHRYLGDQLNETSGRTILEDNKIHIIPVIFLKLNLVPGQILPVIACSSNVKSILRYAHAKDQLFGVSYKLNEGMPTFGTIAAILEFSSDIETAQSFQVKAIGHQRYQILEINRFSESHDLYSGIVLANVKILKDIILTHPYNKLCLHPKKRNAGHNLMCRKRDMWQTPWPEWVYEQFDIQRLVRRVAEKFNMLYGNIRIPDDPSILSFNIMKLGIFDENQVSRLLGIESANERLIYILELWERDESLNKFMCSRPGCHTIICSMEKMFQMSPEGPQGTYCNSWGHLHDMITVTELDRIIEPVSVGQPSSECSWFPGYKWIIILCPNCRNHLGWRFIVDQSATLVPRVFYGLSVRSITPAKDFPIHLLREFEELNDLIMLDIEI